MLIKLKNGCLSDGEIERTKKRLKYLISKKEKAHRKYNQKVTLYNLLVFLNGLSKYYFKLGINRLYWVSLLGFTMQCGTKCIDRNIQTLRDKTKKFILENNIRVGILRVMGYSYVKTDKPKKMFYIDSGNFYRWAMGHFSPYDESMLDKKVKFEDILETPDDLNEGYFIEVDINYLGKTKQKQKKFSFVVRINWDLKINLVIIWMKSNQVNTNKVES